MPETDSRSISPGSCRLCRELQLSHLHQVARLKPGLIRKILAAVLRKPWLAISGRLYFRYENRRFDP